MSITLTSGLVAAALSVASQAQNQGEQPAETTLAQPAVEQPARQLNSFNPQISLVSDFRSRLINTRSGGEKLSDLKELELGFAADVDPFLKAEAYIAFAKEDGESVAEVEEAFASYNRLGKGWGAKFGKIAAAVGRVQRNHADQQNFLETPLVIQDFLGEEGLRAPGVSFSYLLPGDRFNELTFEAVQPEPGNLFGDSNTSRMAYVGHYRTFYDFSDDLSAQVGLTYLNGPSDGNRRSNLYGIDFTMKNQPGSGRSSVLETEAYWANRGVPGSKTSFGIFGSYTQQIGPRLFGNLKVDYSEIPGTSDWHSSYSIGLTLKPTEFHHWRVAFEQRRGNAGDRGNSLDLQFQWMIGAHPAHKY